MSDKLVRAIAKDGEIRIVGAITTEMVNKAAKIHNCSATGAAALGRMITAGSLMGAMLKSEKDTLTIQMNGGGEAKGIVVTAYPDAHVKGYMGNPQVDLPANEKGKLDVGGAIGKDGTLTIIKDIGLKEPYVGQVPIYSGEIGEDLAYYFSVSEQTPSAVGLGVLVNNDLTIKASGGFIIQMMPGASELTADFVTYRLEEISSITDFIAKGMTIEEILEFIFEDMDLKILDDTTPEYRCDCSRERVEKVLLSIGEKDLKELYNDKKTEELKCHFCNTAYKFTHEELGEILSSLESNK